MDSVWLDVLPSLKEFGPMLASGTEKAAKDTGVKAGGTWSRAFSQTAGDSGSKTVVGELEASSQKAQKAVQNATVEIGKARASQREAAARTVLAESAYQQALAKSEAAAGKSATEQAAAQAKVEAASLRLEAAREKEKLAAKKTEGAEDSLKAAYNESAEASKQLADAQERAAKATAEGGEEASKSSSKWDKVKDAIGGLPDRVSAFGDSLGGFAAKAAGAIGAGMAFSEGWENALDQESSLDKLNAQLAATPEQAKVYGDAAGSLYAGGWGESMGDVTESVDAVVSSMRGMRDASQADIEKITMYAMDLSTAFDVDVAESATTAGSMIKNGLARDGVHAMDLIAGAMNQVPKSLRGEVLPVMDEYGKHFQALGIDGETAMGMIVMASQDGAIGMDKIGDALKEFTIRATDMSSSTGEVYETLGLDMETMTNQLLAGGDTAEQAMAQIVEGLSSIEDPGEQAAASLALFGTPLEDLGTDQIPNFLGLVDPMGDAFDSMDGSAAKLSDTLNDNTTTSLEQVKRSLSEMLTGAIQPLLGPVKTVSDWFIATPAAATAVVVAVGGIVGVWGAWKAATIGWTVATETATVVQTLWNKALAANPIGLVITAVAALAAGLVYFFTQTETGQQIWQAFTTGLADGWAWLTGKLGEGWLWIQDNVFEPIKAGAGWVADKFVETKDNIVLAWNLMRDGLKAGWDWINYSVFEPLKLGAQWVQDKFVMVKDGTVYAWNLMRDGLKAGWDWISLNVFSPIKSGAQWVWDKFVSVKDGTVYAWNLMRDGLKAGWDYIDTKVFAKLREGTSRISDAFSSAADSIGHAWDQIREKTKAPVNFVIETVYNNGVRSAFNTIADKVGLSDKWKLPYVQRLATGGVPVMPGYSPGVDIHKFYSETGGLLELSGGEAIMRPEFTRAVGGPSGIAALNTAAKTGTLPLARYADGGVFNTLGGWVDSAWNWTKDAAQTTWDFLSNPLEGFKKLVTSPMNAILGGMESNTWAQIAAGIPKLVIGGVVDSAVSAVKALFESESASGVSGPMMAGGWALPSRGPITSGYGPRWGSFHAGTDIAGGGPTFAAHAGRVMKAGWNPIAGRTGIGILLDHGGGIQTYYGHNPVGGVRVAPGQMVAAGQHIGYQGATGNVTGTHLHFEVHRGNPNAITNPVPFMAARGVKLGTYDVGGTLDPGLTLAFNGTGKPETIRTHEQEQALGGDIDLSPETIRKLSQAIGEELGLVGETVRDHKRAVTMARTLERTQ